MRFFSAIALISLTLLLCTTAVVIAYNQTDADNALALCDEAWDTAYAAKDSAFAWKQSADYLMSQNGANLYARGAQALIDNAIDQITWGDFVSDWNKCNGTGQQNPGYYQPALTNYSGGQDAYANGQSGRTDAWIKYGNNDWNRCVLSATSATTQFNYAINFYMDSIENQAGTSGFEKVYNTLDYWDDEFAFLGYPAP